jgi:serine/threonine protein kinase
MSDTTPLTDLRGIRIADRYTLERPIGRGGMACVWLSRDEQYDRAVAIKTLDPELAGSLALDRFLREVRVTARLNHSGILAILDSGILERADGVKVPWYAMPYIEGESLRARLTRERQLPIDDALHIASAVGAALAAAHRDHVVHRDIKPENVLLTGDHVWVLDFGIAKAIADTQSERLTGTGLVVGTPAYMSPEQSSGEPVDERSDQYSLAAMLYEMIAGEPPFTGPSTAAIIARRFAERPRSLTTIRPAVPRALEAAIMRALERVPGDRFESVSSFVNALRVAPARQAFVVSRSTGWLAIGAVLVTALGAGVWWRLSSSHSPRRKPPDPALVALNQRGAGEYERRKPQKNDEAVLTFRSVLARDSNYAEVWNGLAKAYTRAWYRGWPVPDTRRDQTLPLAVSAVDRSLSLDSTIADAWTTLSIVRRSADPTDDGPVIAALRRSLALDSMQAPAWQWLGIDLAEMGDFQGAMASWRRAARAGPAYAEGIAFLALGHYWTRNFDSAAFWADSVMRLDPNYPLARMTFAQVAIGRRDFDGAEASYEAARRLTTDVEKLSAFAGEVLSLALAGRRAVARDRLHDADSLASALRPLPSHPIIYLAQAYLAMGEVERALRLLGEYQPVRDLHFQLHLRCDPPFDALRTNRRFRTLLIRDPLPPGKGC